MDGMEPSNEGGRDSTGQATAMVASDLTFPIVEKVDRVAPGIYETDPLCDPRWAALVESHPRASVFHSPNWLRALRAVYGYEPVVLTSCPPSVRLTNGLVLCRINSWLTGRRLVSLPFSDHCEALVNCSDDFDEMLLHLKQSVDQNTWKYIEVRPISFVPNPRTGLDRVVTHYLHRLDLSPSIGELFRKFHKNCVQKKILRAEREQLQYEEGTSEELLQNFYRLLVMTRRRQFLPPQPLNWFRGLIAAFRKDIKIRVASKEGVAVASIITISHKKSPVYKYGCSDAAFSKFGATALLFWKTIQEAKDGGCEELDMGRSATDNVGLIAFKERWGAVGKSISYWSYPPRQVVPLSKWKRGLVRRVVSAAPDLVLKAVGGVFYKHIG